MSRAAPLSVVLGLALALGASSPASAEEMFRDFMPQRDCGLLSDPDRSASLWRHLHVAVRSGARGSDRIVGGSIGWNLLAQESLCRRSFHHEVNLEYSQRALAVRADYEKVLDGGHAFRPALELVAGANMWGWIGVAAAAGPRFDPRGIAAAASVSFTFAGLDMELRYDQGLDWDGHEIYTLVGLRDLHLAWERLFSAWSR